jgi:hypothetical protein
MVTEHTDDESNFVNVIDANIVDNAINYFKVRSEVSIYPAKSFAVAIIYARLLVEHFNEDFYVVLDDPELLYNVDPHFVRYSQAKSEYDTILAHFGGFMNIPLDGGWVPYTVNYFKMECLGEIDYDAIAMGYQDKD